MLVSRELPKKLTRLKTLKVSSLSSSFTRSVIEVYVRVTRVAELIRGFIPFRAESREDELPARQVSRAEGASSENTAACAKRAPAPVFLVGGDTGIIHIIAIGVEVAAVRSVLQVACSSWKGGVDQLRSERRSRVGSKRLTGLEYR